MTDDALTTSADELAVLGDRLLAWPLPRDSLRNCDHSDAFACWTLAVLL